MPLYEYRCRYCGERFEKLVPMSASSADVVCPVCERQAAERLITEAKRRHPGGAVLVDVRESHEWRDGHAKGVRHIPLGDLSRRAGELPKDREILLICRSSNRSRTAASLLQRAGVRVAVADHVQQQWQRQDGAPAANQAQREANQHPGRDRQACWTSVSSCMRRLLPDGSAERQ